MPEPSTLINLGGLATPVTKLIEKLSDAVGTIYEPHHVKRMAAAESKAMMIRSEAGIEITDLELRAAARRLKEDTRQQANIEAITVGALPGVTEEADPDRLETDWVSAFFDRARLVSDDRMQQLWSRVLAGEANAPGSFSKRLVTFLADLETSEALRFASLCSFTSADFDALALIYNYKEKIFKSRGLSFMCLSNLESIGLIRFEPNGFLSKDAPAECRITFPGYKFIVQVGHAEKNQFDAGQVAFTDLGKQLARLCEPECAEGYDLHLVTHWERLRYTVSCPIDGAAEPARPTGTSEPT